MSRTHPTANTLQRALLLHRLPGVREAALLALLDAIQRLDNLFDADPARYCACGLPAPAIAVLQQARDNPAQCTELRCAQRDADRLADIGAAVVSAVCERFPTLLLSIREVPPFLYYRGDIRAAAACQVAMVGSRRASSAGCRVARALAGELSAQGLVVTSGLAMGIDGEAHRGALAAGGDTVAVMATGIDQVYPRRHRQLATEIVGRGCLLTEFPPGSEALPWCFPRRNRIISGLSLGTVVVEARLPSGSLITAGTALDQGREVMAVPHGVGEPGAAGCHRLLRDGAALVESGEDVVHALSLSWQGPSKMQEEAIFTSGMLPAGQALPDCHSAVMDLLGNTVTGLDQLVQDSGYPSAQVLAALTELEIAGRAARAAGGYRLP